ncbi:Cytidine deaminase [Planctomycetes bacterium Pla163]|uniref:Cytidine deaminase n=1 Tax=Rohdeia mirabilis TaxID=2528008 RepID=A0A518CWB3_9BACT|nr:Cytidine deaminase [Planctomycetes bacterium Pla163]
MNAEGTDGGGEHAARADVRRAFGLRLSQDALAAALGAARGALADARATRALGDAGASGDRSAGGSGRSSLDGPSGDVNGGSAVTSNSGPNAAANAASAGLPVPPDLAHLVALALAASEGAHAPYSQLSVGAVAVASDGSVFAGCNVESASYGLTLCAERAALAAARVGRAAELVLVVLTSSAGAIPPCGACRQLLVELAPNAIVVSAGRRAGATRSTDTGEVARVWTSAELLPDAFDAGGLPERRGLTN